MTRGLRAAAVAAAAATVTLASLGRTSPVRAGAVPPAPDYGRDVAPILREHCVACHGPQEQESDLRLDSRAEVLKGGMSGYVVVAGKSRESLLVRHVTGAATPRMPQKKPPLPPAQIAVLAAWVDAGLPGADDAPPAGASSRPAVHWAYVKPSRPAV
ncbi:MAG TPA: c-type cytochrome domain-containing protein, partial [Vicinamibacteria bacterium]